MITIFNQRQIYIGRTTEEVRWAKDLLDRHGIRHRFRPFRNDSAHWVDTRSSAADLFHRRAHTANGFFLYVHKRDEAAAAALLAAEPLRADAQDPI